MGDHKDRWNLTSSIFPQFPESTKPVGEKSMLLWKFVSSIVTLVWFSTFLTGDHFHP